MAKLSTIVQHAEFAAQKKVKRVDTFSEEQGLLGWTVVLRFADGTDKYMHVDATDPIEYDWQFDPNTAAAQRRIYEEHR